MHRCSCGHQQQQQQQPINSSFSMFFNMSPMSNYDQHICPYANSSSSSSNVDCTLSLATPSTRFTTSDDYDSPPGSRRFCWDFLHSDNHHSSSPSYPVPNHKSLGGGATNPSAVLPRRCANCDTTSTPLWRNGPRGPKSLCNACGIRFKKEERRANAATAVVGGGGDVSEGYNGNTWPATHKLPSYYSPAAVAGEFRFIDDVDDRDSTFLSWRLNVTDRAGLVHDFTRY